MVVIRVNARPHIISRLRGEVFYGNASWYGGKFHGRTTANGEIYNKRKLTAAHKTLDFGKVVQVVRSDTGQSVDVRINDRGPFVSGRVIDLSRAAAEEINLVTDGVTEVCLYIK